MRNVWYPLPNSKTHSAIDAIGVGHKYHQSEHILGEHLMPKTFVNRAICLLFVAFVIVFTTYLVPSQEWPCAHSCCVIRPFNKIVCKLPKDFVWAYFGYQIWVGCKCFGCCYVIFGWRRSASIAMKTYIPFSVVHAIWLSVWLLFSKRAKARRDIPCCRAVLV